MHFLFFSAQYLPTVGGVERYTYNLSCKLIGRGHRVTVVTSSLDGMPCTQVDENGIEIYRLPVFWTMQHRFPVLLYNKTFRKIADELTEKNFDVAVIQTRFYTNSIWAAHFCKKRKIPSIVIEHGTAYLLRDGVKGFAGKLYEHMAASYIRSKCSRFYGVSQACCNWLENFGIQASGCIYNAVDVPSLLRSAEDGQDALKGKYDFSGKQNICFTGRFVKEKGVDALSSAFSRIKEDFPEAQLIMVGSGPLLEQTAEKKIPGLILPGRLSHRETLAIVQNCDVFCLPTYSEGFSTAVLEAAALKTAIITTPTGGSTQLIKDKNYGIIIPSMDEKEVYTALKYALENPEYIHVRAENAYDNLCENFTWEKVTEKFLEECKELKRDYEITDSDTCI